MSTSLFYEPHYHPYFRRPYSLIPYRCWSMHVRTVQTGAIGLGTRWRPSWPSITMTTSSYVTREITESSMASWVSALLATSRRVRRLRSRCGLHSLQCMRVWWCILYVDCLWFAFCQPTCADLVGMSMFSRWVWSKASPKLILYLPILVYSLPILTVLTCLCQP